MASPARRDRLEKSNTRRSRLRVLTSHTHASLDDLIGQFGSIADYERYLVGIHGFRIPVEEQLATVHWPEVFGHWRPQLIGQALRADMADLGLTPSFYPASHGPPRNMESLLGQLYVLEGSSLGARILYGRAREIGLGEDCGARHLAMQSGASDNWRKFLVILEQAAPVELAGMVTASNAIFLAVEQAFRRVDHVSRRPA